MANETHTGNLNRSKIAAKPDEGVHSAGKSNSPEATLRNSNKPQASAVTTVDRDANKGKCILAAQKQNTSDEKSWPHGRNVIPQSKDNSLLTHPAAAELQ